MSDFVIHKGQREAGKFARGYGADISVHDVLFRPNEPSVITLTNGQTGRGSCLGCSDTPCIEKHPSEIALSGALESFPGDPSLDVCPTRAISWDSDTQSAYVDGAHCIGCGLCVFRCPYGAINLKDGLEAFIETNDPDKILVPDERKGAHAKPIRSGQIATLNAPAATNLPHNIGRLEDSKANLLIRNIMNEIGLNAQIRRRGDTNMRIDCVGFSRSERPFVAEIELSTSVLETPRALLEDVAVLHARYGYKVSEIDPISIILAFPNIRSEYYQVIRDIESVLHLRCRTITIGGLLAMLWTGSSIKGFFEDSFTIGEGTIDLRSSLGIEKDLIREMYLGAFTPVK